MSVLPMLSQAAEIAAEPNWILIVSLVGAFVVLAILFLYVPTKKRLPSDTTTDKVIEDGSGAKDAGSKALEDKDRLSLAEIKVAKRETVSTDKSKEELRELRKERRAASQTDKAIHDREEAEEKAKESAADPDESKADDVEAEKEEREDKAQATSEEDVVDQSDTTTETGATDKTPENEASDKTSEESKVEDVSDEKKSSDSLDDILTQSSSDTGDIFASLFGTKGDALDMFGNADSSFDFAEDNAPKAANATIFPTLGSALIPLDDLQKSADESDANPLDELTKRLNEKAEKKTLS